MASITKAYAKAPMRSSLHQRNSQSKSMYELELTRVVSGLRLERALNKEIADSQTRSASVLDGFSSLAHIGSNFVLIAGTG